MTKLRLISVICLLLSFILLYTWMNKFNHPPAKSNKSYLMHLARPQYKQFHYVQHDDVTNIDDVVKPQQASDGDVKTVDGDVKTNKDSNNDNTNVQDVARTTKDPHIDVTKNLDVKTTTTIRADTSLNDDACIYEESNLLEALSHECDLQKSLRDDCVVTMGDDSVKFSDYKKQKAKEFTEKFANPFKKSVPAPKLPSFGVSLTSCLTSFTRHLNHCQRNLIVCRLLRHIARVYL